MIFVSVGTHPQQFNRLLEKVDSLIISRVIREEVFAQTGYSTYKPKSFKFKDFLGIKDFDNKVKNCSIFITHAGEGNIGTALQFEKKMIVVPRLKKHGEHTNDHQLELAEAVEKEKQAIVCEVDGIEKALKEVKALKLKKTAHAKKIISLLEEFTK